MDKKFKKLLEGKCTFCNNADKETLDIHRIIFGCEGGKYNDHNTCVCCANCHRKIHNGKIKIIRKCYSSSGKYMINYIDENGNELWI
jgi:hypothetical protein